MTAKQIDYSELAKYALSNPVEKEGEGCVIRGILGFLMEAASHTVG